MLKITVDQQARLTAAYQERFLKRLARHLQDTQQAMYPMESQDFSSAEGLARLRQEMRLLHAGAIKTERDVATGIEYFELFGVDAQSEPVTDVLADTGRSAAEKLASLWALRRS